MSHRPNQTALDYGDVGSAGEFGICDGSDPTDPNTEGDH